MVFCIFYFYFYYFYIFIFFIFYLFIFFFECKVKPIKGDIQKKCKDATEKSYLGTRKVSGGGRYFRLEGLNDEHVRNHVDPEGSGSIPPTPQKISQFKALRSLLRSISSQKSSTACSLICCAVFCNQTWPPC